jgi:hypothetical protein
VLRGGPWSSACGVTIRRLFASPRAWLTLRRELGGHWISADPDYGYSQPGNRRKVMLWSRSSWSSVDRVGSTRIPGGRFVSGTTATSIGPVTFLGVCIPWRDAHVRTGRKDRSGWEDHSAYLMGLKRLLTRRRSKAPWWSWETSTSACPGGTRQSGSFDCLKKP